MSILALLFALEIGWMPLDAVLAYDPVVLTDEQKFYVDLQADVFLLDVFFVGGGIQINMEPVWENLSFSPFQANFSFRFGLNFKGLEVGFRHFCYHPIVTFFPLDDRGKFYWEGSFEQIYVRFASEKVKLF